jgi:hypothetical protein
VYCDGSWTLWKSTAEILGQFCYVVLEKGGKISWNERVRNEEVLKRIKVDRKILHTINSRNGNWIGHILRRNCFLKHVTERKIEGNTEGSERGKGYT